MAQGISDRLLDQRLRNRMIEELLGLVDWEEHLRWGAVEYFNSFFSAFPDELPLPPNSALTGEEGMLLAEVLSMMNCAADGTSQHVTEEELVSSGWPMRIKPVAESALAVMMKRGRFSEEIEEVEPSSSAPSP